MPEHDPNTRRPRVLFVIGSLQVGGSENQLTELLTRVHPDRLQATLVTWRPPQPELANERRLARAGVERRWLGEGTLPRGIRGLASVWNSLRLIRSLRPDVVYCWLEESSLLFCPGAAVSRTPVLVARRNVAGAEIERLFLGSWAIRRAERMARLVTGNSEAVLEGAIERGIRPERLRLVRNGHRAVDPLPVPETETTLLGYVARFRRWKGHLRLMEVLSRVQSQMPWRIDLAGDGPTLEAVQREVDVRGLSDHVRFVGPVDDVRSFWHDHHVAVLLSDVEGSPNALIEAAFAGRPIVASDVGGNREVVAPGGGLLVGLDDFDAAAAALRRLIEDPDLRQRLGDQAHVQAVTRFSMEASCEGHLQAIREVLTAATESPRVLGSSS